MEKLELANKLEKIGNIQRPLSENCNTSTFMFSEGVGY